MTYSQFMTVSSNVMNFIRRCSEVITLHSVQFSLERKLLDCPRRSQHIVQPVVGVEIVEAVVFRRAVVAPPDEYATYPDGGHRGPSEHVAHLGANRRPVLLLVQLDGGVPGALLVEQLFRFDTKGSCGEG